MQKEFISRGGELSKLWILLNQLNLKTQSCPKILSPFRQDGKDDVYETIFLFDRICKQENIDSDQSRYLANLVTEIKTIIGDRSEKEILKWFWHYPEEFKLRQRCGTILHRAHKESPVDQ
jgi:hypothetical protein